MSALAPAFSASRLFSPRLLSRSLFPAAVLLLASLGVARPATAVEVQKVVSPGGIEAWLVEDHRNPILSVDVMFRGGGALDPEGKKGLARLVAGLIDEGSGPLDSQAFQKELEDKAIRLGFSGGSQDFTGELQTLTEHRDRAFEMMRLALSEPRFDPEPVERIRGQILAALAQDEEDPQSLASEAWREAQYPDHPYGDSLDGTSDGVKAVTREDMLAFVKQRFARDNLIVSAAGDITPEQLAPLLDSTFASLPEHAAPWALPEITPADSGKVLLLKRDIPQSIARFGHAGLKRSDPDWWAAYSLNYILGGGGFVSRLMEEVREKRGLAYSVYSYLYPLDYSALWIGGVATRNDGLKESLDLIRTEWARMAKEGPTEEELENARTYLTGSFPLRLTSTAALAGTLTAMQRYDLGTDYIEKRQEFIRELTREKLQQVAARLMQPEKLTIVIVGQPEGITPDVILNEEK